MSVYSGEGHYTRKSGAIEFQFDTVGGWRYILQRYAKFDGVNFAWGTIWEQPWSWRTNTIPKTYTYQVGACSQYRVKAQNPKGDSPFANYASGNNICPL